MFGLRVGLDNLELRIVMLRCETHGLFRGGSMSWPITSAHFGPNFRGMG